MTEKMINTKFNIGSIAAENDGNHIADSFFDSEAYDIIQDPDAVECFLIGRTGSGKSAILKKLEISNRKQTIRLVPKNLGLNFISNIKDFLETEENQHLDKFWEVLWEHLILIAVIRHKYIDNKSRNSFLEILKKAIQNDSSSTKTKNNAMNYITKFEHVFWEENEVQLEEIVSYLKTNNQATGAAKISEAGVEAFHSSEKNKEEKIVQKPRYTRSIDEELLSQMKDVRKAIEKSSTTTEFTYVVIDDLDDSWVADLGVSDKILKALFHAVLDFNRKANIKVVVALRANIFYRISDFSQREKISDYLLFLKWSKIDLEEMIDKRTSTMGKRNNFPHRTMQALLPEPNDTLGNASTYILNRSLSRPRDVITFMNTSLKMSIGNSKITWDAIKFAEQSYSHNRFDAIVDEWNQNYPGIEDVLHIFKKSNARMENEDFYSKLKEIAELPTLIIDNNWAWLNNLVKDMNDENFYLGYQPLTSLLYKIGIVGFKSDLYSGMVFVTQDEDYSDEESLYNQVTTFCLHPMFHRYLKTQA